MLDTVRRYVEAGREALTPKKAEDLARALAKEGQARADQVQQLAKDLAEWSRKSSERLRDTIRTEVQRQLAKTGVATKEDVESLKRRIRKIEADAKSGAKTTAAKSATAKSTTPKPATAKSTTPKPATSRRSPTRKTTSPPTIGGGTPAGGGGAAPTA